MASAIEAVVLLCDAAQADPSGKIHMLGAGWSMTGSPTAPSAVAVMLKIPWDRSNEKLPTAMTLVDADGTPLSVPGMPEGITVERVVEVGRPPGLAHGSTIDAAWAVGVPPLPLPPGRYQWRLDVAGQQFSAGFQVRGG